MIGWGLAETSVKASAYKVILLFQQMWFCVFHHLSKFEWKEVNVAYLWVPLSSLEYVGWNSEAAFAKHSFSLV